MYTVPLTISTSYTSNGYVNTYIPQNPIRTHVSSLGSAAFSDGLIVTSDVLTDSIVYSPTSSIILSPYSYTTSPTSEQIERRKNKVDISLPVVVSNTYSYLDVNSDPSLQKRQSKYFYEKLMNDWLDDDFSDLLDYVVIKGKKAQLVNKLKNVKKNSTKKSEKEMKINFINDHIMSKYDVRSFLKKFVTKSGINWYDLKDNKYLVKRSMYKRLKKTIEKKIDE